jgi:hypothetical protein
MQLDEARMTTAPGDGSAGARRWCDACHGRQMARQPADSGTAPIVRPVEAAWPWRGSTAVEWRLGLGLRRRGEAVRRARLWRGCARDSGEDDRGAWGWRRGSFYSGNGADPGPTLQVAKGSSGAAASAGGWSGWHEEEKLRRRGGAHSAQLGATMEDSARK